MRERERERESWKTFCEFTTTQICFINFINNNKCIIVEYMIFRVYLQELQSCWFDRKLAEPWVKRAYVRLYEKWELLALEEEWDVLDVFAAKYPNCCGCCRCCWLCWGTGNTELLASLVLMLQFVTTRHMTDTMEGLL